MTTEFQREQQERRETLRNDQRAKDQSGTAARRRDAAFDHQRTGRPAIVSVRDCTATMATGAEMRRRKTMSPVFALMYARLLAGQVREQDRDHVVRALAEAVRDGQWPSHKTVWIAIRGCGFMPGHPLTAKAKRPLTRTRRAQEYRLM